MHQYYFPRPPCLAFQHFSELSSICVNFVCLSSQEHLFGYFTFTSCSFNAPLRIARTSPQSLTRLLSMFKIWAHLIKMHHHFQALMSNLWSPMLYWDITHSILSLWSYSLWHSCSWKTVSSPIHIQKFYSSSEAKLNPTTCIHFLMSVYIDPPAWKSSSFVCVCVCVHVCVCLVCNVFSFFF